MAKFLCPCGEVIRTSGDIPNSIEWLAIADNAFEWDRPIVAEDLYAGMTHFFRCPTSDHLFVFWRGFDAPATTYAPVGTVD